MKDREKEEVKKIVKETIEEEKEALENEVKKEKKSKKKVIIISSIIVGILLLSLVIFFIFIKKPVYKVTINSGGGKIIKPIVIEDNVVKELPEITPPEGKKLVTWVNVKKEAVRSGLVLEDNDSYEPVYMEETVIETVTLKFVSDTDELIPDIVIPKGSGLILPVKPNNYKDWKFLYWVDKDGYIAIVDTKIDKDTTYYAYWWKPGTGGTKEKTATIKFDTGTDEKIDSMNLIIGSKYVFPIPEKANGKKVFRGWLDDKGNLLNGDSKVEKDMTLKANWKDPYTCPQDCTPSEDGKTCTKTSIVDPTKETICPGKEYEGYCVDSYNISDIDCVRQCSDGYPFGDTEVSLPVPRRYIAEYDTYTEICCAKKIDRVEKNTCPEGYEKDGEKCKKVETINCTAN